MSLMTIGVRKSSIIVSADYRDIHGTEASHWSELGTRASDWSGMSHRVRRLVSIIVGFIVA